MNKYLKKVSSQTLLMLIILVWIINIFMIIFLVSFVRQYNANKKQLQKQQTRIIAPTEVGQIDLIEERLTVIEKDYEMFLQEVYYTSLKEKINKPYADEILHNVNLQSEKTGLDREVILAIIATESEFYHKINSRKGAKYGRGLMQVSEIGLQEYNNWTNSNYNVKELYDIGINIEIGCWLFLHNKRFCSAETIRELYVVYNVGCGNYKNYSKFYLNHKDQNRKSYNALKRFDKMYGNFVNLKTSSTN